MAEQTGWLGQFGAKTIVFYEVALPGTSIFIPLFTLIERIASIITGIQVSLMFRLCTYY